MIAGATIRSTTSSGNFVLIYQDIHTSNKNLAVKFDARRINLGDYNNSYVVVGFDLYSSDTLVGIAGCHYILKQVACLLTKHLTEIIL